MLRKLRIKAMAAAVALTIAGSANAAITADELFFTAFDAVSKTSFTLDMNVTMEQLKTGTGYLLDLDSLTNWGTFLSGVTGVVQWAIAAGASTQTQVLSSGGPDPAVALSDASFATGYRTRVSTIRNTVNAGNPDNGVINGSTNYSGIQIGTNGTWAGTMPYNTTRAIGATSLLTIYPLLVPNQGVNYGSASFTNGNVLSVTPVPEPGTYALMLAGLFAVGAIARRRLGK